MGDGSDAIADLGGTDMLQINGDLADWSNFNIQEIYDGALKVSTADIKGMSASLDAVLDGADDISQTGEVVDEVFIETDPAGSDDDPLTDDVIG
ncbi:MAG: hypothetical protein QF394_01285 [Rhodospirillales bacterium]|nr:hypothetical protein [Rhodospirillales bacterium]